MRRLTTNGLMAALLLARCGSAADTNLSSSGLDLGYRQMYNLDFDGAHRTFGDWQRAHPRDAMGPVSDAAAWLFSELDRLHVLQMELFVDDDHFKSQHRLSPDPQIKQQFEAALSQSRQLAARALERDPRDAQALFAGILGSGLHADYMGLIEKRYLASLGEMKHGRAMAERLLGVDPTCYDAYLAIGVENYLLSLKPAPVRWLLRLGGAQADKEIGLEKLRLTADKGHYLLPYARLLLAVAALRDKHPAQARYLLEDLSQEFPKNNLYIRELVRIH